MNYSNITLIVRIYNFRKLVMVCLSRFIPKNYFPIKNYINLHVWILSIKLKVIPATSILLLAIILDVLMHDTLRVTNILFLLLQVTYAIWRTPRRAFDFNSKNWPRASVPFNECRFFCSGILAFCHSLPRHWRDINSFELKLRYKNCNSKGTLIATTFALSISLLEPGILIAIISIYCKDRVAFRTRSIWVCQTLLINRLSYYNYPCSSGIAIRIGLITIYYLSTFQLSTSIWTYFKVAVDEIRMVLPVCDHDELRPSLRLSSLVYLDR